jgi:hypothetical protein
MLKLLAHTHTPEFHLLFHDKNFPFTVAQIYTCIIQDQMKHGHHLWPHPLKTTLSGFPEPLKISWILATLPSMGGKKATT